MPNIKPCKYCEATSHWPYQCRLNPKNRKQLNSLKPEYKRKPHTQREKNRAIRKWFKTRKDWFKANPAPYYVCSLQISKQCPRTMLPYDTTLDNIIPRSARPDLRYDFSNLQPAFYPCNSEKGSRRVEGVDNLGYFDLPE